MDKFGKGGADQLFGGDADDTGISFVDADQFPPAIKNGHTDGSEIEHFTELFLTPLQSLLGPLAVVDVLKNSVHPNGLSAYEFDLADGSDPAFLAGSGHDDQLLVPAAAFFHGSLNDLRNFIPVVALFVKTDPGFEIRLEVGRYFVNFLGRFTPPYVLGRNVHLPATHPRQRGRLFEHELFLVKFGHIGVRAEHPDRRAVLIANGETLAVDINGVAFFVNIANDLIVGKIGIAQVPTDVFLGNFQVFGEDDVLPGGGLVWHFGRVVTERFPETFVHPLFFRGSQIPVPQTVQAGML